MNEFKIEVGKWYKTRSGEKVLIVEAIVYALDRTHLGIRHIDSARDNSRRALQHYYANGRVYESSAYDSLDLIEEWKEPLKGEVWFNVYSDGYIGQGKKTVEDAVLAAEAMKNEDTNKCIARIKVSWTEGQFDN